MEFEEYIISESDFTTIIEEDHFFRDIKEINKKQSDKIIKFLKSNSQSYLAVQKMFAIRYNNPTFTMDEIQNEFCTNLIEYLGDDYENNSQIAPAIFRVLQKGCLDILNNAIEEGDLWARDQNRLMFIKNTMSEISHDITYNGNKTRKEIDKVAKIIREEGKKLVVGSLLPDQQPNSNFQKKNLMRKSKNN